MKLEIAQNARMAQSGSSLLKLMQSCELPVLDLLVREAIQNALDASNKDKFVNVDFRTGDFSPYSLNVHLEGAEDNLNKKFRSNKCQFIEIRDSNTVGLTGPVSTKDLKNSDDYGNLLKLVYEISKPQQEEGAGGSWGLGKTIYFRVGIGLVIYYSRISEGGKYKSRLAACIVEDQQKKTFVNYGKGLSRGVAWWGKYPNNSDKTTTVPLENENEIKKILQVFNTKTYKGSETGTTIIIPYVDYDKLLREAYPSNEEENKQPYWTNNVSDYLRVAIQRWYAPRLVNTRYPYGAYLKASVDGIQESVPDMLPLFKIIRELYLLSTGYQPEEDFLVDAGNVLREKVARRTVFESSSVVGDFVYTKMDVSQLKMVPPDTYPSPYQQINNKYSDSDDHSPIIMYTRKPGMIVEYDISERSVSSGKDEYIIGLFVLNSDNKLRQEYNDKETGKALLLEEYIRQGEKADHAKWQDHNVEGSNPGIVNTTYKKINEFLKKSFSQKPHVSKGSERTGLSYLLADMLMPSTGFGSLSSGRTPPVAPKNDGRQRQTNTTNIFVLDGPFFEEKKIRLECELQMITSACDIFFKIPGEFKKYNADEWENEIGTSFPFELQSIIINSFRPIGSKGHPSNCDLKLDVSSKASEIHGAEFSLEFLKSNKFKKKCSVRIKSKAIKRTIKLTLFLLASEQDLKCEINAKDTGNAK